MDVIQQSEGQRLKQNAQHGRVIPPAAARAQPLLVSTIDGRPLPEGWRPEGKLGHDAGRSAQRGEDVQAHLANCRGEAAGLAGASQRGHGL